MFKGRQKSPNVYAQIAWRNYAECANGYFKNTDTLILLFALYKIHIFSILLLEYLHI